MKPAELPGSRRDAIPEDRFAELLADAHESLALGSRLGGDTSAAAADTDTPAELVERLSGAGACLRLLERVRRAAPGVRASMFGGRAPQSWDAGVERLAEGESCLSDSSPEDTTHDEWPRTIGRFEVVRPLGQGGHGVVFLAHDPRLQRHVALKVPRPETVLTGELKRRFLREAEAAASLSHAGIVPVFETGQDGAVCYIAAGLCAGPTLKEWLTEHGGAMPAREAARLVAQLAAAVQHAHDRGVLHRDLKPANILLEPPASSGHGPAPRITDFGLAKLLDGSADETRSGAIVGTPAYMAPEQADARAGEIGPPTDIYALGVILYELLTGVSPFARETPFLTMRAVREEEPVRLRRHNRSIPRDLEAVCLQCLEKRPAARYASATALADELDRVLRNEPVHARRVSRLERLVRWSRRNPVLASVSLLTGVLLVGVSVVSSVAAVRIEQQRQSLQRSLEQTAQAERTSARSEQLAQRRLFESLVSQARAEQASGRVGQRFRSLAALAEAARLARDLELGATTLRDLRNTAIASFALADLAPDRRWPVAAGSGLWSAAAFDPAVECYAVPDADKRGVMVHAFADNQPLQRLVASTDVPGSIAALAFGPQGRCLVAQFGDTRRAKIVAWDLDTGEATITRDVQYLRPQTYLQFAFSGDERLLAVAQADKSVGVFDLASGQRLQELPPAGFVAALAFDPQGRRLAVSRSGHVQVIDLDTSELVAAIEVRPLALAWSPAGDCLALAGPLHTVQLWKPGSDATSLTLTETRGKVADVLFSPDGRLLAVNSHSGTVRLFDAITGRDLVTTTGRACRFSRDGRWLGLQSRGAHVERVRVCAGHEHLRLAGSRPMANLLFVDPRGSYAVTSASGETHFWDLDRAGLAAAWSRETGTLAAVLPDSSGLQAWRREPNGAWFRHAIVCRDEGNSLEVQPGVPLDSGDDAARTFEPVFAMSNGEVAVDRITGSAVIRYHSRGGLNLLPAAPLARTGRAALDPRGRWVAAVDEMRSVIVADRTSGETVWRSDLDRTHANVGFSPGGDLLVVSTGHEVRFVETATWQLRRRFERRPDAQLWTLNQVAWSFDGSLVACQEHDHVLRLFDGSLRDEILRLEVGADECLHSLAFSGDGSRLVAGTREGHLHVWNLWESRRGLGQIGLDWTNAGPPPAPAAPPRNQPLEVRFLSDDFEPAGH